jgi:hypothetical protein
MVAIKTHFDGKAIEVPKELKGRPPSEILVILPETPTKRRADQRTAWSKAQETAFAKVWDNDEDAIYDSL